MSETNTALVWLRNDLRIADNPALLAACQSADRVVAIYVHETGPDIRPTTGAARWWLHESLKAIGASLASLGIALEIHEGDAAAALGRAVKDHSATGVHWNRRYAQGERATDTRIKTELRESGIEAHSYSGNLLAEPWTIKTGQERPYSVFTPFWKSLRNMAIERPLAAPTARRPLSPDTGVDKGYETPAWAEKLGQYWEIGEAAAQRVLSDFLDQKIEHYAGERDFPAKDATSGLSPHLRFGEISARQIWHAARMRSEIEPHLAENIEKFLSELAWRDFSYHQLYHRDDIARISMQENYADMPWREARPDLVRWQRGRTGFPIVDAGMRQLWETGYMHNRVRMLVASLLTKNLLIDWRQGEAWFWDCLVDADSANNPASWQWVAGSGLDAAPYFRIFNPVIQGERFDPSGDYVRRWVPELAALPDRFIHCPFAAPMPVLRAAGVVLGKTYPEPITDLKQSRQRALEAYGQTKE